MNIFEESAGATKPIIHSRKIVEIKSFTSDGMVINKGEWIIASVNQWIKNRDEIATLFACAPDLLEVVILFNSYAKSVKDSPDMQLPSYLEMVYDKSVKAITRAKGL